jgi:hypothetical protein
MGSESQSMHEMFFCLRAAFRMKGSPLNFWFIGMADKIKVKSGTAADIKRNLDISDDQLLADRVVALIERLRDPYGAPDADEIADTMEKMLAVVEAARIWERDENRTDETEHNLIMAVQNLDQVEQRP